VKEKKMAHPLMPKATALWLVENTSLTFGQIAEFCGLHPLEIQALADGEIGAGLAPFDPILNNQLTLEEIARCQRDVNAHLQLVEIEDVLEKKRKGGKYTPVSLRKDRPHGIAWMLKNHPEVSDAVLIRLLGTTKNTIEAIRSKTHHDSAHIKPQHPVTLGLCSEKDFDEIVGNG
jgi:uncharacterized protein